MGMFMAVGRGSDNPPRMIVMRSGEEGQRDTLDRHLAIVGKGVCFDSGGISIKPSDRMEEMKMDKAGACTVIAAIETVARLAPGTPPLAVALAVENMPGPHSTRPGDIVTALNGKKVDITNTDAEGRLILGDAMTYAERLGATHLVDVATLTGAVARALGHLMTGAFGRPQDWYDQLAAAAGRAGERYWQLPLIEDYVQDMESWYSDLQNAGSAEGGPGQERAVPARVRRGAVDPPRHRGYGLLPQGAAISARARHGCRSRHARRARRSPGPADERAPRRRPGGRRGGARRRCRPLRDPLARARRGAPARPAGRLADGRMRRRRCRGAGSPAAPASPVTRWRSSRSAPGS